jgi:hypothetical protein
MTIQCRVGDIFVTFEPVGNICLERETLPHHSNDLDRKSAANDKREDEYPHRAPDNGFRIIA